MVDDPPMKPEHMRITCPETAHLEEIDLERTKSGIVITGCSRFSPDDDGICDRRCARRLDLEEHADIDDRAERILVVYAGSCARTKLIADVIATHLVQDAFTVERADLDAVEPPPASDYDAIVIGSRVHVGRPPAAITSYIRRHRETLATMPAFLFTVSPDATPSATARIPRTTGWLPTGARAFGGVGSVTRHLRPVRLIARWVLGLTVRPEDLAREYPFTNWQDVRAFAETVADAVPEIGS